MGKKEKEAKKDAAPKDSAGPPMEQAAKSKAKSLAESTLINADQAQSSGSKENTKISIQSQLNHVKLVNNILLAKDKGHAEKISELERMQMLLKLADMKPIYSSAIVLAKWQLAHLEIREGKQEALNELFSMLSTRLCPGSATKPFSFTELKIYLAVLEKQGHGDWMVLGFLNDWLDQHSPFITKTSQWVDPFLEECIYESEAEMSNRTDTRNHNSDFFLSVRDRLKKSLNAFVSKRDSIRSRIKIQSESFDKSFDIVSLDLSDTADPALTKKAPRKDEWSEDEMRRYSQFLHQKLGQFREDSAERLDTLLSLLEVDEDHLRKYVTEQVLPKLPPGSSVDKVVSEIRQRLEGARNTSRPFWGRWMPQETRADVTADVAKGGKDKKKAPTALLLPEIEPIQKWEDWLKSVLPLLETEKDGLLDLKGKDDSAPTIQQILTGDISSWTLSLDSMEGTADPQKASNPSDYLQQFTLNQEEAIQLLDAGIDSDNQSEDLDTLRQLLSTQRIFGLKVLFFSRGLLDADKFDLPMNSQSPLIQLLTCNDFNGVYSENLDSDILSEAMDIVNGLSLFEGLSPSDFFDHDGLEVSPSIKAAVERLADARESLSSKSNLAPLHSQLVIDVVDCIDVLRESGILLPSLTSSVARFVKLASRVRSEISLEHLAEDNLREALCGLELDRIRELRAFLLQRIGELSLSMIPVKKTNSTITEIMSQRTAPQLINKGAKGSEFAIRPPLSFVDAAAGLKGLEDFHKSVLDVHEELERITMDGYLSDRLPRLQLSSLLSQRDKEEAVLRILSRKYFSEPEPEQDDLAIELQDVQTQAFMARFFLSHSHGFCVQIKGLSAQLEILNSFATSDSNDHKKIKRELREAIQIAELISNRDQRSIFQLFEWRANRCKEVKFLLQSEIKEKVVQLQNIASQLDKAKEKKEGKRSEVDEKGKKKEQELQESMSVIEKSVASLHSQLAEMSLQYDLWQRKIQEKKAGRQTSLVSDRVLNAMDESSLPFRHSAQAVIQELKDFMALGLKSARLYSSAAEICMCTAHYSIGELSTDRRFMLTWPYDPALDLTPIWSQALVNQVTESEMALMLKEEDEKRRKADAEKKKKAESKAKQAAKKSNRSAIVVEEEEESEEVKFEDAVSEPVTVSPPIADAAPVQEEEEERQEEAISDAENMQLLGSEESLSESQMQRLALSYLGIGEDDLEGHLHQFMEALSRIQGLSPSVQQGLWQKLHDGKVQIDWIHILPHDASDAPAAPFTAPQPSQPSQLPQPSQPPQPPQSSREGQGRENQGRAKGGRGERDPALPQPQPQPQPPAPPSVAVRQEGPSKGKGGNAKQPQPRPQSQPQSQQQKGQLPEPPKQPTNAASVPGMEEFVSEVKGGRGKREPRQKRDVRPLVTQSSGPPQPQPQPRSQGQPQLQPDQSGIRLPFNERMEQQKQAKLAGHTSAAPVSSSSLPQTASPVASFQSSPPPPPSFQPTLSYPGQPFPQITPLLPILNQPQPQPHPQTAAAFMPLHIRPPHLRQMANTAALPPFQQQQQVAASFATTYPGVTAPVPATATAAAEEEEEEDLDDLMNLCGVAAPSATTPSPTPHSLPLSSALSPGYSSGSSMLGGPPTSQPRPGWMAQGPASSLSDIVETPSVALGGVVDENEFPTLGSHPRHQGRKGPHTLWNASSANQGQGSASMQEEDEEMQRVLEESTRSLRGSGGPAFEGQGGMGGPAMTNTQVAGASGLVNRQGEYNCFLNVIIQCLFHCGTFRAVVEKEMGNLNQFKSEPVVYGLVSLFKSLSENERRAQSVTEGAMEAVDPSVLREALDALPGHQQFRRGEMNDPSEVLSVIFDCLARSQPLLDSAYKPAAVSIFGLVLKEELICSQCEVRSHVIDHHVEFFHITSSSGLRIMAEAEGGRSTVNLLRIIENQNLKMCDKDLKGCGAAASPTRTLEKLPDVFSLQVAWEPSVQGDEITKTLELIDTEIDLKDLYHFIPGLSDGRRHESTYRLSSIICYYGLHYHAFVLKPAQGGQPQWVMFDDTTVASVGDWPSVIKKCTMGRIQPAVLFYHRVRGG